VQYSAYPYFFTVPAIFAEKGRVNRFIGLRTPGERQRRVQGQVTYR
jgi:hypothetical protein